MPQTYRDLMVWQRAMDLAAETFSLTHPLHTADEQELAESLAGYAVRIPARIAEGYMSEHRSDYARHLDEAYGALKALETLYLVADRLCLVPEEKLKRAYGLIEETSRMLYGLRRSVSSTAKHGAAASAIAEA